MKRIAAEVAKALQITGSFNMQFLAKHNQVKVIECNLRASRSLPFVSKVTGTNFAEEAMRRMLGEGGEVNANALDLDYVGVKVPMFSFSRLDGADPLLGVEMASTGEVGCIGSDLDEALLQGLMATGFKFPERGVLLSLGPLEDKYWFAEEARAIVERLGLTLYATEGTAEMLDTLQIPNKPVGKSEGDLSSLYKLFENGEVDLVINVPREYDHLGRPDGYLIRRMAIDNGVPLFTDRQLARALIDALLNKRPHNLSIRSLDEHWQQSNGSALTSNG